MTKPDTRLPVLASTLVCAVACASGPKATASVTTPGDDDDAARTTMIERQPAPEPEPEPESEPQPQPRYTSVEVFIDPNLLDACGLEQPKVYFETDSAEVRARGDDSLEEVAACLHQRPLDDELVDVYGHADPRGTDEYNRELGLARANAVASSLMDYGVADRRIDTYSEGEHGASDDPEDWATDRRVVVMLDQ